MSDAAQLHPLNLESEQYGTPEGIGENISYAFSLGLPELSPSLCLNDGTFVIVGSGPTVKEYVEEIREEAKTRPICAVKGAYDFLVENDIKPTFFVSVEPRFREILHPQKESIFLIASRCDPETFKQVEGYNVILWNAWGSEDENPFVKGHIALGGGPTSGLRALSIGYILGFRKFNFYGMDSCLIEGEKRIGQGEIHNDVQTIDVIVGGRSFLCTMAMADQAQNFQEIYEFIDDITIHSFGDGLISAILAERRKQGLRA